MDALVLGQAGASELENRKRIGLLKGSADCPTQRGFGQVDKGNSAINLGDP